MSDVKTEYSVGVTERRDLAQIDRELASIIKAGFDRKEKYGGNWESVNINEVVHEIAPGSVPVFRDGKIIYFNREKTMAVVADVSGYLRVESNPGSGSRHRQYLDQHGRDVHNYKDEEGKQHGRSRSEFNRVTHFIIKKREEM